MKQLIFLLLLAKSLVAQEPSKNQCVMYDSCGWDQDYGPDGGNQVHFLNCHYTGPPKPATDEMKEILKEVCPHLAEEVCLISKIIEIDLK